MSGRRAKQKRQTARRLAQREDLKEVEVNLLETARILESHITKSLCETVFQRTRTTERQRMWTLHAMAEFWTAVILRAPQSLQQALEESAAGKNPQWPHVGATPEAFFQRSRDLNWKFFATLYQAFAERIYPEAPACFAQELSFLQKRFRGVWIVDGSRLDAVAHRLKILWPVRSPVLPGCLTACYDLFRGFAPILHFSADAAEAEMDRIRKILPDIPEGTLLLGDRLHASVQLFELLTQSRKFGLFRRNARVGLRKLQRLSRRRFEGGILEDWLVEAGSGQTAAKQTLRWIRFRDKRGVDYELLTNVLNTAGLSASEAMALYPYRWDVERLFYDLKEVLNLHCFYAANPNAVAMQVYAAGLVHTAMRIAQGQIAEQVGIEPEMISTEKFFPRMAAVTSQWCFLQCGAGAMRAANPGKKLREPAWNRMKFARVKLGQILMEPRNDRRRKRRFCPSRKKWKSFYHISGGRKLT
jgi:hypothetical protein